MTSRLISKAKTLLLPVVILVQPSGAIAQWVGDIADNTIVGRPYGQLASASHNFGSTELNVVCFEEDSVWLYLDHRITNNVPDPNIVVYVDRLPPINFTFRRIGENYTITNRESGFWKLIAQMAAGAEMKVEVDGVQHKYSLEGFSKTYLDNCGWVRLATKYEAYLSLYK